jgi:predicted RNA binding protein YcfA (HicA-like mRNA interferase family)
MPHIPAISGRQLIKLLQKDGWEIKRQAKHGKSLAKKFDDRTRVTVVRDSTDSMPTGTLRDILGRQQTGLGVDGFLALIRKHGLH